MTEEEWHSLARIYCPLKVGSIDGTIGTKPHDKALKRAINAKYAPNSSVTGDPECTVFVSRLDPNTTELTLQQYFSKYGSIVHVRLVRDIVTGFSKRYAFIEYKRRKYAKRAYEEANRGVIDGNKILVDYEHERTMIGWKPRRLGGGFGGNKESRQLRFGCRDRRWKRPIRLPISDEVRKKRDNSTSKSDHFSDDKHRAKRKRVKISHKSDYRYDRNH